MLVYVTPEPTGEPLPVPVGAVAVLTLTRADATRTPADFDAADLERLADVIDEHLQRDPTWRDVEAVVLVLRR